jgi:hypothetical protein
MKKKVNFVFIFELFFNFENLVMFDLILGLNFATSKFFFCNLNQIHIGPIGLVKGLIVCLLPLPPFAPICPCSI